MNAVQTVVPIAQVSPWPGNPRKTFDQGQLAELAETAPSGRAPVHPARFVVEATKAFPKNGNESSVCRRR